MLDWMNPMLLFKIEKKYFFLFLAAVFCRKNFVFPYRLSTCSPSAPGLYAYACSAVPIDDAMVVGYFWFVSRHVISQSSKSCMLFVVNRWSSEWRRRRKSCRWFADFWRSETHHDSRLLFHHFHTTRSWTSLLHTKLSVISGTNRVECQIKCEFTPCPRKKEATLIFAITSSSIEIFFFTIFEAFCSGIIRAWHSTAYIRKGLFCVVVGHTETVSYTKCTKSVIMRHKTILKCTHRKHTLNHNNTKTQQSFSTWDPIHFSTWAQFIDIALRFILR